jgi:hypothetical protein
MKVEEVKQAYIERFGGYPSFLLMGADDDYIIEKLSKCLETGQELEPENEDDLY